MDLLLVEVRGTNSYLNNGLAYLGGSLVGRCSFNIIDLNYLDWSHDRLKDYIIKSNPRILGFSVKSTNVSVIDSLIAELKGKINSLIIVGGPHVSLLGVDYVQANQNIDYGLPFEAEESLACFLEYLNGDKQVMDVPGLIYRDGDTCRSNPYTFISDLDKLAFPAYDHFEGINPTEYFKNHPYPLLTSRGCPYNCIYCSVNIVSGKTWRFRSVENIIDEIQEAKRKYSINTFELVDDNFTLDIDRALCFCQALIDKEIHLTWGCPNGIRADRITAKLAELMFKSGCRHVSIGVESGVPEIFNRIKKGEQLTDITMASQLLMNSGIKVTGFFIVGLPGDNIKNTRKSIKFFKKLKLNGGIKWNFLIPYPHTELWAWIVKEGKMLKDFSAGRHFSKRGEKIEPIFETPDFSAQERLRAWKTANLSVGAYSNIFKMPKNPFLLRIKIFFYLLVYSPMTLFNKLLSSKIIMGSCFLLVVFAAAVSFWYSPVIFKGNSVESMTEEVVLARNYALTGKYAMEDKLNVVVAPENVSASAMPSTLGNKFSAISFSYIFKIFGWQNWNNLVLISNIICAVGLIFFTLSVYLLFGLPAALIFPFVYILLPFNASTAQYVGFMEFALLYFSLFAFFYSLGRKTKYQPVCWALSGLFLGLACLARESFFVFLPTFFFWLLFKKKFKQLLAVFIPVGLLLAFFWLPAMLGIGSLSSDYAKLFVTQDQAANTYSDFMYYGHIYPDPYTYHFDQQAALEKFNAETSVQNPNYLDRIERIKIGQNIGVRKVGIVERLIVGLDNIIFHLSKFFAIEFIGGPLIFILLAYGLWVIGRRDKESCSLFLVWLLGNFLIISFVVLASRNHLMDYGWIIAALIALGLADIPALLSDHFRFKKYDKLIAAGIIVLVLYSLILADHVYFGRSYDKDVNLSQQVLAQKIQEQNIDAKDVIAVGERSSHYILNYLTGKSTVYFNPETIARLTGEHKLQEAFDRFNVKYVAGFDASTTDMIVNNSNITNIAIWPDSDKIASPPGFNKMWLLNIIK